MGLWTQQREDRDPHGPEHHSDKGVPTWHGATPGGSPNLAIVEVGSSSGNQDNALAEAFKVAAQR